ncbi:MAG: hypothetical protein ACRDNS_08835 [Trebonia sp.]
MSVRVNPSGETTRREPLGTRPCVSRRELRRLANLARRAEAALGPGQYLEWGLAARELYLLQSSPIRPTPIPSLQTKSTRTDPESQIPS